MLLCKRGNSPGHSLYQVFHWGRTQHQRILLLRQCSSHPSYIYTQLRPSLCQLQPQSWLTLTSSCSHWCNPSVRLGSFVQGNKSLLALKSLCHAVERYVIDQCITENGVTGHCLTITFLNRSDFLLNLSDSLFFF